MIEKKSLWNTEILGQALLDSVRKLDPRGMVKNPVMFVVEVGCVLTSALLIDDVIHHRPVPGFTPPYAIAVVHLAEGPRMMPRVEGIAPEAVKIGMQVKAKIIDDGGPLVVFEPVP